MPSSYYPPVKTDDDLRPSVDHAVAGPVIAELPDGLRSLPTRMFRGAVELSGGEAESRPNPHPLA
ncbi:hypothetical protein GCM10010348_73300 [Streptomyces anthocyanicus]|uniref:Uncharacterized protein n=1 Tax=Streptomyces coelicolor (strain ATCC BAA-471 / A3(2) / M145) TaxID=100226 RepID=Q9K481_STRCO|nr:hypothetical protein [Streptomyces sp. SID7813]QFI46953.1 hypothetical protein FQ762_37175 [Streptomyces coelicolor A3(2)]TYP03798.1 hypothetical protein FHV91_11948 [Streptomyces coelicolor]GHC35373.1 hypothetical protein GCM10010348_73300 [Streptomyces anthocyanicus]TYP06215.1 hypothetical protein FHV98_119132 [Streptomyces coelicolor A3(2)]